MRVVTFDIVEYHSRSVKNTIHGRLKKMVHEFSFNKPSKVAGSKFGCTDLVNIHFIPKK